MYRNVEFYNTPDGEVCYKVAGSPARVLSDKDRGMISYLLTLINDRYPTAYSRLMELYSKSSLNRNYYEYLAVSRFVRCNFGEYDQYNFDIDNNGAFRFEEVKCPLRGECKHEGVICKPALCTNLTERELGVFRLIVDGLQTDQIAEDLFISPATVKRHRDNIKAKIGVNSTAQMVNYWHTHQLK